MIRPAVPSDCAGLARVQVDSYRSAYAGLLPADYLAHFTYEEQEQDWRDLLAADPAPVLFVAQLDAGEMAGYALGSSMQTDVPGYTAELVALHVRQPARGQGLGRQLVQAIAQHLRGLGCTSLVLWVLAGNQPARSFYEKLGGKLVAKRMIDLGVGDFSTEELAYRWEDINPLCGQRPVVSDEAACA
jgi:ribosomal protein S18 acetylase RimI-like enzyme